MTEEHDSVVTKVSFETPRVVTLYTPGGSYDLVGIVEIREFTDETVLLKKSDGNFAHVFELYFYDVKHIGEEL